VHSDRFMRSPREEFFSKTPVVLQEEMDDQTANTQYDCLVIGAGLSRDVVYGFVLI
jgi:hypothetical protein